MYSPNEGKNGLSFNSSMPTYIEFTHLHKAKSGLPYKNRNIHHKQHTLNKTRDIGQTVDDKFSPALVIT